MTPLKNRLDEKREKDSENYPADHTEGLRIPLEYRRGPKIHPEVAKRKIAYKAGAAPRDVLIAKLGDALNGTLEQLDFMGASSDSKRIMLAEIALSELEKFLGEEK